MNRAIKESTVLPTDNHFAEWCYFLKQFPVMALTRDTTTDDVIGKSTFTDNSSIKKDITEAAESEKEGVHWERLPIEDGCDSGDTEVVESSKDVLQSELCLSVVCTSGGKNCLGTGGKCQAKDPQCRTNGMFSTSSFTGASCGSTGDERDGSNDEDKREKSQFTTDDGDGDDKEEGKEEDKEQDDDEVPGLIIYAPLSFHTPNAKQNGILDEKTKDDMVIINGSYGPQDQFDMIRRISIRQDSNCHVAQDKTTHFHFIAKKVKDKERGLKELNILIKLRNSMNVIKLHGYNMHNGLSIFLEYVKGPRLDEVINNKTLEYHEKASITCQLIEVLKVLKNNNVVHNEIKAENFVFQEGKLNIVLTGFGSADHPPCRMGENLPNDVTHLAPERANGKEYSFPADLFSCMITVVHLYTSTIPLAHIPVEDALKMRRHEDAPLMVNFKRINKSLHKFVISGLSTEPDKRPSLEELAQILETCSVEAQNDTDDDNEQAYVGCLSTKRTPIPDLDHLLSDRTSHSPIPVSDTITNFGHTEPVGTCLDIPQ